MLAWSPSGKELITSRHENGVELWDTVSGKAKPLPAVVPEFITAIAWGPDGSLVLSSGYENWQLRDGQTWKERCRKEHHAVNVLGSLAFDPNGKWLATSGRDKSVRLWNLADGSAGPVFKDPDRSTGNLAWSPDGKTLAVIDQVNYYYAVAIWDLQNKAITTNWKSNGGNNQGARAIAYSPDGKRLAFTGAWEPTDKRASGIELKAVLLRDPDHPDWADHLQGHLEQVSALSWHPKQRLLASAGWDGTLRVWDVDRKEEQWIAVALRNGHVGVFSAAGELLHLSDPAAEADLVYIVEPEPDRTELLTPAQFRARLAN